MRLLLQIGLVAVGSALGGLARWGVGQAAAQWLGTAFPYGTLFINISGSLFLGWFSTVMAERFVPSGSSWLGTDDLKLLLAVGFTGAYTTFSTFEYENYAMLREGNRMAASTYIFLSLFLGLIAVWLGTLIARWHTGGPA